MTDQQRRGLVGEPHPETGMLPLQPNPNYRRTSARPQQRTARTPKTTSALPRNPHSSRTTRGEPVYRPRRSRPQIARHATHHRINQEKVWTWLSGYQFRYFPQYCAGSAEPGRCAEWHYYSDGATGRLHFKEYAQAEDFFREKGVGWS